jgi:hypothetical protein
MADVALSVIDHPAFLGEEALLEKFPFGIGCMHRAGHEQDDGQQYARRDCYGVFKKPQDALRLMQHRSAFSLL